MVGEPAPLALQGQMSIKLEAFGDQAAKGVSLGFFFNGHAQAGDLDLMTLLGSAVAHLHWQPGAVELVDGQGARQYATLGELSQAALGEALPLDTLVHWMQGRADPSLPALAGETPQTFEQLGWQIDVRDYANKKLTASRAASPVARGVRIKVYLDR
jgi:outer membrane lipoprotein LolB